MRSWFVGLCLLCTVGSCIRRLPSRVRASQGSCEATCDTYAYCKGDHDEGRERVCIAECRGIFSEDGKMDEAALLNLQALDCSNFLAFVEGQSNRAIGEEKLP